jgi:hypothetical protein
MKKTLLIILSIIFVLTAFIGCDKGNQNENNNDGGTKVVANLALKKELIDVTTYNEDAYLQPIWYTREMYNEPVVFVGEESEATLVYKPSEIISVRDYRLQTIFVEGTDYKIEDNKIIRLKNSAIPYWEVDDYFLSEQPSIAITAKNDKIEYQFDEQRYIKYSEGTTFTDKQIVVTYRHNEAYTGKVPENQCENMQKLLDKMKAGQDINMMVYGDSVAVGCSSSGSSWGGNISPYTPTYTQIVKNYLEEKYNIIVNYENQAVGGWKASDCYAAWKQKIAGKNIDLLIFRIGGNDGGTEKGMFKDLLEAMLVLYFKDNPDGCVVLQSSESPNEQSTWVANHIYFEKEMEELASDYEQISVAPVFSIYEWIESTGKRDRDILANNINHSNDFGVRIYAQTILKVMLGDDFCKEVYVNE